ncbi:hypothetical protein ACIRG5_47150 [Lentzea sp. NPDC102401]|uniref:hypothetical protein n=1 Tax=Lentzea sp. NPDC102401 TaxID=3364128 RepID=UPI00380A9496
MEMLLLSQQRHDDGVPGAGPPLQQITAMDESAAAAISPITLLAAGVLVVLVVLLAWLEPGSGATTAGDLRVRPSEAPLRG